MAVFALNSATILVGTAWTGTAPGTAATPSGTVTAAIDVSAFTTSVEVSFESDELDFTNFASGGWRQKITGLATGNISLTFNQDFAATTVDDRFGLGGTVGFVPGQVAPYYIDVKPTSAVRSATNPSIVAAWLNTGGSPVQGSVGDLAVVTYTFPFTGRIARLTT